MMGFALTAWKSFMSISKQTAAADLVELRAVGGVKSADHAYLLAVDGYLGCILGMLPIMLGSYLIIYDFRLLYFTDKAIDNLDRLEVESLFVAALIIEHHTEALAFLADAVLIETVDNSAYLEYAVFIRRNPYSRKRQ